MVQEKGQWLEEHPQLPEQIPALERRQAAGELDVDRETVAKYVTTK